MENISLTKALEAQDKGQTREFAQQIGGWLFASREDKGFQDTMCRELTTRVKQLIAKNRDFNIYGMLFTIHKFPKPEVINVQLVSVSVYNTFIVYSLSVDITDKDVELLKVVGPLGPSYETDRLITTRMDLYHDTVNDVEFLSVTDAGVARSITGVETPDTSERLLPQGLLSGYWPTLPPEIELLENYGNIKAGTILTLDVESEVYRSKDTTGGIPAIMYHKVVNTTLPVVPDPDSVFDSEQPEEIVEQLDFEGGDNNNNDGLQDFFQELE
jgi:hypothetical protein